MSLWSSLAAFTKAWWDKPLEPGTRLGTYEIVHLLGEGSYGLTYLALDHSSGSRVAIKQARPSKRARAKRLLAREAEALGVLAHPHLPAIHQVMTAPTGHFLVMSYMQGDTMEQLIFDHDQRYSESACIDIALQLLHLVAAIHAKGYVHLDLRIPNVLFQNGQLYVIDFGLACRLDEAAASSRPDTRWHRWLARTNDRVGKPVEIQADLEDVGHFMLFMLYSSYEPQTDHLSASDAVEGQERSWREELPLSAELRSVLERLLRIGPPYATAGQVWDELQKLQHSGHPNLAVT